MRVLITQSAEDTAASVVALESRGHQVVAVPLVTAERAPPPKINLAGAQGFLVTSTEGARALADHVGVRTFPAFADSEVTTAALRRLGFKHVETAKDDAADLARLVERSLKPANGALIYACSTAAPVNLSAMLSNMGFAVRPLPLYTIKRIEPSPAAFRAALQNKSVDTALFLTPDEARAFVALVQREEMEPLVRDLTAVAATPVVAAPLRALKLGGVIVPPAPDLNALFDALSEKLVDRVAEERAERERRAKELADAETERQRIAMENAARERAEKERLAREAAARAEQERLAREQTEREKAEREAQERTEKERVAQAKAAAEKAERERRAAEKAEQDRIAREKAAAEKAEKERLARERAAQEQADRERQAQERAERERVERERAAAEKAARERRAAEKAEQDRIAREKAAADKAEKERIARERAEQERAERAAQERIAAEKAAQQRAEKERLAHEQAERARIERERLAAERAERDRIARETAAAEKAERERLAQEQAERDRIERERLASEKAERDRIAREQIALAKSEQERIALEKAEQARQESERLAIERAEQERFARAKAAAEKAERERLAAEQAERDRMERERLEAEKAEQERVAREKAVAEKAERERLAAEQAERDRIERERLRAEKAEQERIAREKAIAEKAERARLAAEQAERERIERERLAAEKAEQERVAREKAVLEKAERERLIAEQAERNRIEGERLAAEKTERDRAAREKAAAEKAERARVAEEQAQRERLERERLAAEKTERNRIAQEAAARTKAERQQAKAEKQLRAREEKAREEAQRLQDPPRLSLTTRLMTWFARPPAPDTAPPPPAIWDMAVDTTPPAVAAATIVVAQAASSVTMAPTLAVPDMIPEAPTLSQSDGPQTKETKDVSEHSPSMDKPTDGPDAVEKAGDSKPVPRGGGRAARLLAEDAADLRAKDQRFKYLGHSEPEPEAVERQTERQSAAFAAPAQNRGGAGRLIGLFVVLVVMAGAVIGTASWWVPRITHLVQTAPATSPAPDAATPVQTDITALKARVAVLEQEAVNTVTPDALKAAKQELMQRLATLEGRKTGEDGDAVTSLGDSVSSQAKQLAAVSARLATLEAAIGNTARLEDLSKRLNMLEGRSAEAHSVLALSDRVTALETTARRTMVEQSANIALLMAVSQWREALLAGRPFALELQTVKALAARVSDVAIDDSGFAAAATQGLPTLADLQRQFGPAAAAAMRASAMPEGTGAWYRRVLDRMLAIVTVRRLDGDAAGTGTAAVLARAENRLDAGDLSAAVTEMDGLSGAAAAAAQAWQVQAKARVAAEHAASDAATKAVASVAATGDKTPAAPSATSNGP